MSNLSPIKCRHAPSITPVAIGQPLFQRVVVAQELGVAAQIANAGVDAAAPLAGQASGGGLGIQRGGDVIGVAGQHGQRVRRAPVFGGRVISGVQAPGRRPQPLQSHTEGATSDPYLLVAARQQADRYI
ncbi:hypothetical protein ACIHFD_49855 [Nonomuraea sp. NPDC051941]|uniref:hypothetical protein n=1 Tax=Nonomuraea sp. NPDC051941 TaxID=3364373 RepID=UPI0037CA3173